VYAKRDELEDALRYGDELTARLPNARVTPELKAAVEGVARLRGVPVSDVIRDAVTEALGATAPARASSNGDGVT
jgi:Ribbon-helix-helix protein, copG family